MDDQGFCAGAIVQGHRLVHVRFEVGDPSLVARMRRHEFHRLAFIHLGHPLPEVDGRMWIAARGGHQQQADAVGFGLVFAAKGQENAELTAHAHHGKHLLLALRVHVGEGAGGGTLGDLYDLLLGHPLGSVVRERVADFMPHHGGERILGLRHREDAGVDDDLAPRQAEGVDLFAVDDVALPFEIRRLETRLTHEFGIARRRHQVLGQLADDVGRPRVGAHVRL